VLAVEGEDERSFFDSLLHHIGLRDVQIEPVGGKDQFPKKFPALLQMPGFYAPDGSPNVKSLAVVRDRDQDNAFESIANIVRKADLTPPDKHGEFSGGNPRIGIFIMPGEAVKGTMLEDLCLATVKSHPAMDCVNGFADCAEALPNSPRNTSKAKCQAFLAAQPEIANCVGLGAKKGYWDLDSPALYELKQFLLNLR
jgi:hypothetical protein